MKKSKQNSANMQKFHTSAHLVVWEKILVVTKVEIHDSNKAISMAGGGGSATGVYNQFSLAKGYFQ